MENGIVDLEVGFTDEERAVRDTAHRFADEVLRPIGAELDRLPDPESVIAPGSALWRVHEELPGPRPRVPRGDGALRRRGAAGGHGSAR